MSSNRFKDREPEPKKEWVIPPYGTSPVTGISGVLNWGGINRPDKNSRWVIGDADFDDLVNFFPQGVQVQQLPYKGSNIATLAASVVYMESFYFLGAIVLFALCSNGHIYQISLAGGITDLRPAGGFATNPPCGIANWQATNIIIADPTASAIYSWNGSAISTVFSSQANTGVVEVYSNRLWIGNGLAITWTNIGTFNSFGGDSGTALIIDSDAQSNIIRLWSFLGSLYVFGSEWIKTINNLVDIGSPAVLTFNLNTVTSQIGVANRWCIIPYGNLIYYANAYGVWQLTGSTPLKVSTPVDGFFQNLNYSLSSFSAAYGVVFDTPCLFWHVYYNGDSNMPAGHTILGLTFVENQPTQWFRIVQGVMTFVVGTSSGQLVNSLPSVFSVDQNNNLFQLFQSVTTPYQMFANTKIWDINGSKLDYMQFDAVMLSIIAQYPITGTIGFVPGSQMVGGIPAGGLLTTASFSATSPASGGLWINTAGQTGQWFNTIGTLGTWAGSLTFTYLPLQVNIGWANRGLGLNLSVTGAGLILQSIIVGYSETEANWGP